MIEIVDIVGEPVKAGMLIAFGKAGGGDLQVGIVLEIFSDRLTYLVKTRRAKYKSGGNGSYRRRNNRAIIGYGDWKVRRNWIMLTEGEMSQNKLVAIKNPLFLLNNKSIAAQMEVIDMAKDVGILPPDYIFGQPLDVELNLEDELEDEEEE